MAAEGKAQCPPPSTCSSWYSLDKVKQWTEEAKTEGKTLTWHVLDCWEPGGQSPGLHQSLGAQGSLGRFHKSCWSEASSQAGSNGYFLHAQPAGGSRNARNVPWSSDEPSSRNPWFLLSAWNSLWRKKQPWVSTALPGKLLSLSPAVPKSGSFKHHIETPLSSVPQ